VSSDFSPVAPKARTLGSTLVVADARQPTYVTVSGSFRRHLPAIQEAVQTLRDLGAVVLSPADPHIAGSFGEFLFVRSDVRRSIKGVQNRHLEAIGRADFLWLVCPDGYVGQSAAMEIGFAVAARVPVYSDGVPSDWTLRQYVTPTRTVAAALLAARGGSRQSTGSTPSLVLEPESALAVVRGQVDDIERRLLRDRSPAEGDAVEDLVTGVRSIIRVPTTR
jgi:hypothetical protein